MRKPAQSEYPLLDVIRERWSPRAFSKDSIPEKELYTLFEAARWAPSCFNDQPWFYIYSTREEPEKFSRLLQCLVEQNQVWARNAPVLVLAIARRHFSTRDRDNRHAFHDLGMSLMSLILQATAQGIFTHPMAGFSVEKAMEILYIPEGYEPVTAIAMGYPGKTEDLPPDLQEKEKEQRQRKEIRDFVFKNNWQSAD